MPWPNMPSMCWKITSRLIMAAWIPRHGVKSQGGIPLYKKPFKSFGYVSAKIHTISVTD
jgi:hypothetical protein